MYEVVKFCAQQDYAENLKSRLVIKIKIIKLLKEDRDVK